MFYAFLQHAKKIAGKVEGKRMGPFLNNYHFCHRRQPLRFFGAKASFAHGAGKKCALVYIIYRPDNPALAALCTADQHSFWPVLLF